MAVAAGIGGGPSSRGWRTGTSSVDFLIALHLALGGVHPPSYLVQARPNRTRHGQQREGPRLLVVAHVGPIHLNERGTRQSRASTSRTPLTRLGNGTSHGRGECTFSQMESYTSPHNEVLRTKKKGSPTSSPTARHACCRSGALDRVLGPFLIRGAPSPPPQKKKLFLTMATVG